MIIEHQPVPTQPAQVICDACGREWSREEFATQNAFGETVYFVRHQPDQPDETHEFCNQTCLRFWLRSQKEA